MVARPDDSQPGWPHKHKLVTSADILGGKVSEEALELAVMRARKAGKPVNMSAELDEAEEEVREQKRLEEAARKARLVATAKFTTQSVDPFDVLHLDPVKPRGWDNVKQLTEKQRSLLTRQGINPDNLSFSQGKQLIGEILRRFDRKLCSFKQAKVLRKYGYDTEVSFAEASAMIDALAKSGWVRAARATAPEVSGQRTAVSVATQGDPSWN